ncbi:MAG: hypothetical protein AAGU74_02440 [Bacillota bacterium]
MKTAAEKSQSSLFMLGMTLPGAIVLLLAGLIFLGAGLGPGIKYLNMPADGKATVMWVAGRYTGIEYIVEGHRYTAAVKETSTEFVPGRKIAIRYDPEDPARVTTNATLIISIGFGSTGLVITVIGLIWAVRAAIARRRTC